MRIWFPNDADGSISIEDCALHLIGFPISITSGIPSIPEIPPDYTDYLRKFLGDTNISEGSSLQTRSTLSSVNVSGLNIDYLRKFLGDKQ